MTFQEWDDTIVTNNETRLISCRINKENCFRSISNEVSYYYANLDRGIVALPKFLSFVFHRLFQQENY